MGLVQYALKFRITFYVLCIFMLLGGVGAAIVAPKDVLPTVDIPVVIVVWTYTGLDTTDMSQRITTYSEFSLSNNVNNIERMESTTLQGRDDRKNLFRSNRERGPCHYPGRLGDELHSCDHAAGGAAADCHAFFGLLRACDPARALVTNADPVSTL